MREILFRGKDVRTGYWKEGSLVREWLGVDIGYTIRDVPDRFNQIAFRSIVDPKTVGQFTGLTDKNGKKIFEGDIVKVTGLYPDRDGEQRIWRQFRVGEAFYYHGAFFFGKWGLQKTSEKCIEIIGNIHDNPELLEDDK